MREIVIIGSGPAGVAAATYLKRFNKDVLVITSDSSTLSTAHLIENYYGFKPCGFLTAWQYGNRFRRRGRCCYNL